MKGLLYKEFFLGRKNYLAFLALFFVFALMGALVCLSMICGNLQSIPAEDPESVKTFAMIFTYAPYAFLLILCPIIAAIYALVGFAQFPDTELEEAA